MFLKNYVCRYNDETYEAFFSIGLQGIDEHRIGKIEDAIISTLLDISR